MASAYLSRTFGTPTNASKFTYSGWIKRSGLGGSNILLYANGGNSQNFSNIMFNSSDSFFWHILHSNSEISKLRTNAQLRDTNAWYHLVFQYDSTQATAANRTKMYINGVEVTSYATQTNSGQNSNYHMNTAVEHIIGAEKGNTGGSVGNYFDGQMAHVHFVDGTIYAPSTFGQTDATTGIWKPKTSPGISTSNYGNNGFWLKFDNSANMGLDSSGNSNNWTTSGTIIQTKDTPSNVFATMNINTKNANASVTLTNVGSTINVSNHADNCTSTLMVSSGKWYWEGKQTAGTLGMVGIRPEGMNYNQASIFNLTGSNQGYYYYGDSGNIRPANSSYGATYGVGDIIGFALDLDNNKLYFSKNGTWQNSGVPTSGSTGTGAISIATSGLTWGFSFTSGGGSDTFQMNFGNGYFGTTAVSSAQSPDDGNGIFEYDVPAGYRALCTKSINAEEYS